MRRTVATLSTGLVCLLAAGDINAAQQQKPAAPSQVPVAARAEKAQQQKPAAPSRVPVAARAEKANAVQAVAADLMPLDSQKALIQQYCQVCHNDRLKSGGMTLTSLDLAHVEQNAELAEKLIKKLKTGLMPPAAATRRPDRDAALAFVRVLETQLDKAAAFHPNPGTRPFQRLTREEYARSIRELLGIDVDLEKYLPPDTISDGLDNIADTQIFSAALMEGYVRAAGQIAREALGDPRADATSAVYKLNRTASQLRNVPGAPMGTRGGISIMFNFPADGEYNFRSLLHSNTVGELFGNVPDEQLEVSIDGERVAVLKIDLEMAEDSSEAGLNLTSGRIFVKTGPHRVSAAFLQARSEIVDDDLAEIGHTLASVDLGDDGEQTAYPHLREFEITGPFNVTGVSDSPIRRKVFTCRPANPSEQLPCATKIVTDLARKAYRRPVASEDVEGLMTFYRQGREKSDFESGIRTALQAILTSPDFVFKFEAPPAAVKPGQNYRIGGLALASRLSYFLWGTAPDEELISTANSGKLRDPLVLAKQVRRMLADSRSMWLSTKFAGQWLQLPDLLNFHPDPYYYPQYDQTLALSMKREVELFFDSIVREDRNLLDLLTANDTFLDERLAQHYGIPNIRGSQFRHVELSQDYRRGLLGKGAILALTSVADRTSPVQRGKWVLTTLLGTPPPPPPPLVPGLDATAAVSSGKLLTVRERMESHRASPACTSCHRMMDPIGLALENFDVTGEWRTWDKTYAISSAGVRIHTAGIPVDSTTTLYDGTPLNGPDSLRQAILKYSDSFIGTVTERLLAFATGRRVESSDMPVVRSVMRDAAKNNNRFSSFILGIVKSPTFQMSRAEADTTVVQADSASKAESAANQK